MLKQELFNQTDTQEDMEISDEQEETAPIELIKTSSTTNNKYVIGILILVIITAVIIYLNITNNGQSDDVVLDNVIENDKDSVSSSTNTIEKVDTGSVELIKKIEIEGVISGPYRDINAVQILSNGELVYKKSIMPRDQYVFKEGDIKETFFIGSTTINFKDALTPVKEVGGKITYLISGPGSPMNAIIYGSETKSPGNYFSEFMDIGGKLAYVYRKPDSTFETLVYDDKEIASTDINFIDIKEVDGKLIYAKRDRATSTGVLQDVIFYDGNKIEISGEVRDLEIVNSALAYTVYGLTPDKYTLFYDGKKIDEDDAIGGLMEINGELVYIKRNKGEGTVLMKGNDLIISGVSEIYSTEAIGNKFAYAYMSIAPSQPDLMRSVLVLDGTEVASTTFQIGWGRASGDIISGIADVYGRLAFSITNNDANDTLYYDGKLIHTAQIIGTSYDVVEKYKLRIDKSSPLPFYFYGADEKDGVTTFSIYRINP